MKKLLFLASALALALGPQLASAAYNDVTLTSSVSIQADGQTINIDGDSNVVESLTVNSGSFTFVLDTNSEVTVKSASNKKLEHDAANTHVVSSTCESNNASIHFKGVSDNVSVTVTPKNTTCPEGGGGGGGGSSGGGGGGGGGGITTTAVLTTGTREAQIAAILKAVANLQAQIAKLNAGATVPASGKASITANLKAGSRGPSVKALQQFLNSQGFVIVSSGPGSPGNETEFMGNLTVEAVKKFQVQYGIAGPGLPGYGMVGPKTRAKISELSGN